MKNIAILGGSFNPIHIGHLIIGESVYATMAYDKILYMPSGKPPHKTDTTMINKNYRLKMCQLAVRNNPHFEVSDYECKKNTYSYTVDTIRELKEKNPDTNYSLIIGADTLMSILTWKKSALLFTYCEFIVVNRPGFNQSDLQRQIAMLSNRYGAKIKVMHIPNLEISSTQIRKNIAANTSIKYLVPKHVEIFIHAHGLYSDTCHLSETLIDYYKGKLKKNLSEERFYHSVRVMETSIQLAKKYNLNIRQAGLAGLLHDCAKQLSNDQKLEICKQYHITLTKEQKKDLDLIHAKLGAVIARSKYRIYDKEILSAIEFHTTGKSNMTDIEKVVYIADFIEPERSKAENLKEVRSIVEHSLDDALLNILEHTLDYLEDKDRHIDPESKRAFNYYKQFHK